MDLASFLLELNVHLANAADGVGFLPDKLKIFLQYESIGSMDGHQAVVIVFFSEPTACRAYLLGWNSGIVKGHAWVVVCD